MHMIAPKSTRRRQRLFMTDTYGLRHLCRTRKYGSSTPNSLFNSKLRLFPGKLHLRWDGPFIVTSVSPHGVIELRDPKDGTISKVNGQRLKPCIQNLEPGIDMESVNLL
jgi:hypothetical protein